MPKFNKKINDTNIRIGEVRFSYANSLERIKEGLDRLERYLVR